MQRFSLSARIKSFKYAITGVITLFKEEHNSWIHALAAILVITLGIVMNISNSEWIAIILCVTLVLVLEAVNTAFENLANLVEPDKNELVKKVKDLSAGAVLIAATGSVVVAAIIFIPRFLSIL